MIKRNLSFLILALFAFALISPINIPSIKSSATSQTQLIVDGTLGTIPNTLEPYCGTFSCVLPVNNLVGYWSYSEGSGTTTWDNSGNGNTGTLHNSPSWVTGIFNNALNFSKQSSQYVSSTSTGFPVGSSARSIFLWVKPLATTGTNSYPLFCYGQSGSYSYEAVLFLYNDYAKYALQFTSFGNDYSPSGFDVGIGDWTLVGFTYTALSTSITEYINTTSSTGGLSRGIALNTYSPSSFYVGENCASSYSGIYEIENIRVYNVVLNASQVSQLYNGMPSGNGYYSPTNYAYISTYSQNQYQRLTQYTVDSSLSITIPNYNSSMLLSYTQSMTTNHHWIFGNASELNTISVYITLLFIITGLTLTLLGFYIREKGTDKLLLFFSSIWGIFSLAYVMHNGANGIMVVNVTVPILYFLIATLFLGILLPMIMLLNRV